MLNLSEGTLSEMGCSRQTRYLPDVGEARIVVQVPKLHHKPERRC